MRRSKRYFRSMVRSTGRVTVSSAPSNAQARMALDLFSFVSAHGALELPSIFIAGGAGLRLGTGLLFPGMLARKDALALAAKDAIQLLAGVVPLLFVAGMLEAFLSPSGAPKGLKFAVGGVLLTGLGFWLAEGGRSKDKLFAKII